jgi:DNA-directed RNA polymerase
MIDPIEAQMQREKRHSAEATAQHLREVQEALRAGRVDDIPAARRLIARVYEDVRAALEPVVETKARGPGAALRGWLRRVPIDTLAVLSIRVVLAHVMRDTAESPATLQRIGHALGRAIEQEALVQEAYRANALYLDRTWEYLRTAGTTSQRHIQKTMRAVVHNVLEGQFDGHLTNAEYIHLGKHGLQACLDAGLVELQRHGQGAKTNAIYVLPAEVREVLAFVPPEISGAAQMMFAEPTPWDGAAGGGYYTERMKIDFPLRRVNRRTRKPLRRVIRDNVGKCTDVLACANYLQAQAFSIHSPTLELIKQVWNDGGGALGIPKREPPPEPAFPFPETWDKDSATEAELERFASWKRRMHAWHMGKKELRKAQQGIGQALRVSAGAADRVWFPTFIDSRGRYYYRGVLNPQGDDMCKALLHFADKRPLGERGLYWIQVHVANCFGEDKARFDARAAWAVERKAELFAALEAPADSCFAEADTPLGAFAAVWEWREAERSGNPATYCTGLPVHMDATCSGLQHFSAMLRDPVGGLYVNLYDSGGEAKADIYRKVAEVAQTRINRDAANPASKDWHLAKLWTQWEIPRTLAKGPVMTYVYGATLRGVAEGIADWLEEQQVIVPDGVRIFDLAYYLGRVLFSAIEDVVPAAAAAMRWLRERARSAAGDTPMLWFSPTGLLVEHDYRDFVEHRVKIRSCGITDIVVREDLDQTRGNRMQNAVAPNFVHALDAAHLTFTARLMADGGHAMVAIHDSFGTHPSSVDEMHTAIREAFVRLYSEFDPIALFLRGIGQEEVAPPPKGSLDLTLFRSSEFGFC